MATPSPSRPKIPISINHCPLFTGLSRRDVIRIPGNSDVCRWLRRGVKGRVNEGKVEVAIEDNWGMFKAHQRNGNGNKWLMQG